MKRNFLSLLLDSGHDELIRAYFIEKALLVEEMKQVCDSSKRDLFLECMHERLFSTIPPISNVAETAIDEIKEEFPASVPDVDAGKSSDKVDEKYFQKLEDCVVFHLASSDKASLGVRKSLNNSLKRILGKNYFLLGQIVGKSREELSLTEDAYSTLVKNFKRCDNVDIETSVDGLDEALRPEVEKLLLQKQELEETQKVSIIQSLPLEEVEFFSPKSSFYKNLSKTEKNLLTRLKAKMVKMGVKYLSEVFDYTEEDFCSVFELPHKYYELFQKMKSAI